MIQITPLLLCGGSGTRLWPLSRKGFPKQFASLLGNHSLFQQAALRLSGPDFTPPLVITNADFRFIVTEQLADIHCPPFDVLIEPEGRNTAPAILAGALHRTKTNPAALILAAPCDHLITDPLAFQKAVQQAVPAALAGQIVTFGIQPTRPETGYGWLELAPIEGAPVPPLILKRFVEKPGASLAEHMFGNPCFLWNSGLFLFRADTLIAAFEQHAPDLIPAVATAVDEAQPDLGFLRLKYAPWSAARSISIDYAIMEHAQNLTVMPFAAGWSDLGDWAAIARELPPDADGNTGTGTAIDCTDTLLYPDPDLELVGIGLTDIVAVALPDAVLIAHKSRTQDVRLAVDALKRKGARAAEQFPRDHRPWGWFETLAIGDRFQVKRIHVHPGAALSLQSHVHRAEHWVVVSGTAQVTLADKISIVAENQSIYIPLGAKHRLENPGKLPMILIEVQTGAYLGEDDITRYDDIYARGQGAKG